jgi:hypothetical protein
MSEYKINILPFNILKIEVNVGFAEEEKSGYNSIYKNDLPKNFPLEKKENIEKYVWWTLTPQERDSTIPVNLLDNKRFAKHYFNKILFEHFSQKSILTNRNFINDTEVWLEETSFSNNEFRKYNKFALRFDNNDLIEGTSLLVSYDGDSYILNKSLAETAGLESTHLSKVKYQNRISKFNLLSDEEKVDNPNIFPILNRDIKRILSIDTGRNFSENKYRKYFDLINKFYNEHLKNIIIFDCIKIYESGFYTPYDERIGRISEESNLLQFGNSQKNFTPYIGIKENGPIESPPIDKPIKFIFIFHEDDKNYANKLYSYLKKGYKSFPGLESFVKIQFEVDNQRSIRFRNDNPLEEIKTSIQNLQFDQNTNYAALYISRIKRDSTDQENDEIYFRLKELLLHYKITSQVIYKNNIDNPSFNYFLPNIAIAMLAKLGGIPWRLYRPIKNDLIVGIGADRSIDTQNRLIGCAFCFKNDGRFNGFNAFEKTDTAALANSLQQAIEYYIAENKGFERLVIHYYKKMSYEEEEPIKSVLNHLNLSLPYIIVTVNDTESKDYILFDNSFDGKMPQSGTFIKIKWNEFILCNNTRYSNFTGTKIDSFPFPIKIKFKSHNFEKVDEMNVVRELIDQVYQFSRMYWKSVRQRNMPVTIEYSEIVAKMISHFANKELEQFARNSLWFL